MKTLPTPQKPICFIKQFCALILTFITDHFIQTLSSRNCLLDILIKQLYVFSLVIMSHYSIQTLLSVESLFNCFVQLHHVHEKMYLVKYIPYNYGSEVLCGLPRVYCRQGTFTSSYKWLLRQEIMISAKMSTSMTTAKDIWHIIMKIRQHYFISGVVFTHLRTICLDTRINMIW